MEILSGSTDSVTRVTGNLAFFSRRRGGWKLEFMVEANGMIESKLSEIISTK